jgi:phosphatidylglycerol lysyltransferase
MSDFQQTDTDSIETIPPVGRGFQWIWAIVLVCLVWVGFSQWSSIKESIGAVSQGSWPWLIPASLLIVLYYWLYAVLYWSAFRCFGVYSAPARLVGLVLGSIAVSVAAPGGAAIGGALFVGDAKRRGQSGAKAAAGALLVVVAELLGVACISIAGIDALLRQWASKGALWGALLLVAFVAAMIALLTIGLWAPDRLQRIIQRFANISDKITARMNLKFRFDEDRRKKLSDDLISCSEALRERPIQAITTLGISMVMFGVLLLSLALLFPAFGENPMSSDGVQKLCAGFVVGMFFWIVSPTPQGIGIVEGAMTLTFIKMGMSRPHALLISLSFRALAFWLPMLSGLFFLKWNHPQAKGTSSFSRSRSVLAISVMIGAMGVVNLVSAVRPGILSRVHLIHQYLPLEITHGSRLAAALAGFALLLLARGLARRKRTAWALASVVLFLSVITHLAKALDYEEATLAAILMVWLVSSRSKFYASSDPPSVAQAIKVTIAAALFTLAYGVTGLWFLDHYFKENYGFRAAVMQTLAMFTFGGDTLTPTHPFGVYFRSSIYGVAVGTFTYSLLMILRPVVYQQIATDAERDRAANIVENFGKSPLARYALFNDKRYFFSESGSVIAYTLNGRTAVALGDPIGSSDDVSDAVKGFTQYCQERDWRVGFYETLPDNLKIYEKCGYHELCMGHDAIVLLNEFTLAGGSNKQIRWSVNRFAKLGYRVEVLAPPYGEELIAKLRGVSDEWLTTMNGAEKRFSLGWFDEAYLQTCRIMVVLDPDLQVTAFANILPTYGDNETTIDLMRRRANAENYTMEYLFVKLLEWAKESGYKRFNLGLSPLSGVGSNPDDPAMERVLNYVYENLNQFYSFKGLHTFKSKFKPTWEPRYLIYTGAALPQIALAAVSANSGGKYLQGFAGGVKAYLAARKVKKTACPEAQKPAANAGENKTEE